MTYFKKNTAATTNNLNIFYYREGFELQIFPKPFENYLYLEKNPLRFYCLCLVKHDLSSYYLFGAH